ncbi:MAG: ABC transporter permease [Thermomicrobiales bacterium]
MNEIFGVPMTTFMTIMVVLLAICLLGVAWVAWRRPVVFKMGVRNIPRRKAQTVLIIVGLMLSTLIISAAFGTGDTVDHSVTNEVYKVLGHVDEVVVYSQEEEGDANNALSLKIPASALGTVELALADNPNVDGIAPMLIETVPIIDQTSNQGEPAVVLTGFDPARLDAFGGLKATDGSTIDLGATADDEIVISETAAEDLDASVGDEVIFFYGNQPTRMTVAAIAEDSALSGVLTTNVGGMVIPLDRMQQITGQTDQISAVAISNTGGVRDSEHLTDAVYDALTPALAGESLGVSKIKQDGIEEAEGGARTFTAIFLLMGLFSIAVGILLIILIFSMLAAERRPEMGMARAVGMQRSQLVQQFVSEGAGYAILAGFVGSALGVAAAVGLAYGMRAIIGEFFPIEPMVQPRSLIVAYCMGVVITFMAVVISSWRISRLNVVAAIRDIPDVTIHHKRRRTLIWGIVLFIAGTLLTAVGLSAANAFAFFTGMSMVPFGILVVLRYFGISGRLVATLVGLFIIVLWLMPSSIYDRVLPEMSGGFELFFVSGICLVAAATIVIMQNTDLLLAGLTRLGGLLKGKLPSVRTAIAYPGANRGRTGMTIAMFSLVVFSLVMMATISTNFSELFLSDEANAGWDIRADSGTANPIDDITAALERQGIATDNIAQTAIVTTPNGGATNARMPGADEWKDLLIHGMGDQFIGESELFFQQRAEGYDSDEAIIEALLTEPNVAVIDSFSIETEGFGADPNMFTVDGLTSDDKVFAPVEIEVQDPDSETPAAVTLIGVIDSKITTLFGLYANQRTTEAIFPTTTFTSYYLALDDPSRSEETAKEIEAALLQNGVQATSIRDELKDSQRQATGFLYLIEGFMGLGLIVGVAAIGVIMFRTVVERRQQIGVLRAIGFQRGMISESFLIEAAFVVIMGVLSGVVLGLALAWVLFQDDEFGAGDINFLVPWGTLAVIVVATIVAALLMTWIPARQASRIAPAEALRYE